MSIREQETACKRAAKSLERARKELVEAEKREKAAIREHETVRRNVILALFDLGAALFGLSAIAKDWKARAKALAGGETQYRRPIDVYFFFDKKRERAAAYASSENDLLKEIATDKSTRAGHYPWARKGKLGKRAPRQRAAANIGAKPNGVAGHEEAAVATKPVEGKVYCRTTKGDFVRVGDRDEHAKVAKVQPLDCHDNPEGDPITVPWAELEGPYTVEDESNGDGDLIETHHEETPKGELISRYAPTVYGAGGLALRRIWMEWPDGKVVPSRLLEIVGDLANPEQLHQYHAEGYKIRIDELIEVFGIVPIFNYVSEIKTEIDNAQRMVSKLLATK